MCLSFAAIVFLSRIAAAAGAEPLSAGAVPPSDAPASHCHAVLFEKADLSPQEPGTIREIKVAAGQHVAKDELLLQLDDSKVLAELRVAERKLEAANTKFEAADINVEYATSAKDYADQDLKILKNANENTPRSVPLVKIHEQELKCKETELAIKKAESDRKVAREEAKVAAAEVDAAKVMVARHKIVSPIAGEVDDVKAHVGETTQQPMQPVIYVVNLDSLWVQGSVDSTQFARGELDGKDVTVMVPIPRQSRKEPLPGKVVFVRQTTDDGGYYMVRAKVENRKVNGSWLLSPGSSVEMTIHVGKLSLEPLPR